MCVHVKCEMLKPAYLKSIWNAQVCRKRARHNIMLEHHPLKCFQIHLRDKEVCTSPWIQCSQPISKKIPPIKKKVPLTYFQSALLVVYYYFCFKRLLVVMHFSMSFVYWLLTILLMKINDNSRKFEIDTKLPNSCQLEWT